MDTDQKTLKLLVEVQKRKQEISKLQRPNWKTNCTFSFSGDMKNAKSLHVENDVQKLVQVAAFLISQSEGYEKANKLLGTSESFLWQGYPLQDWLDDISTCVGKILLKNKREKLKTLEARLDAVISPELRAQLELEAIQTELE